MLKETDIAIVGAGILGTSLAWIISSITSEKITLIEQEKNVGLHASSRNTGKVHSPFIYDPDKKKILAKATLLGYNYLKKYCNLKKIVFKEDGVIEIAIDQEKSKILSKHLEWGLNNGLEKKDIVLLEKKDIEKIEPNLLCQSAILCKRDASVDYGLITNNLLEDAIKRKNFELLINFKVNRIKHNEGSNEEPILKLKNIQNGNEFEIKCKFLINAAGGNSLDILNMMKIRNEYRDLHFRGDYWIAPKKYHHLTKHSIYSIPSYPQFPFLDPHWIIRANGNREIGPNACPVFSPFGYNKLINFKEFIPKIYEIVRSDNFNFSKGLLNKEVMMLVAEETLSSISKYHMINRVKKFLPQLNSKDFKTKGVSGIRSNLIDKNSEFIMNPIFLLKNNSFHILNYNSPGATGALPIAYSITFYLIQKWNLKYGSRQKSNQIFSEDLISTTINEMDLGFAN